MDTTPPVWRGRSPRSTRAPGRRTCWWRARCSATASRTSNGTSSGTTCPSTARRWTRCCVPKEEGGLRDAEQLERRDVQDPAAETDVELVCPVRAVAEDADERRVLDGIVPQDEAAEEVEPRASAKRNNAAAAATWTQRLRITRLAAT